MRLNDEQAGSNPKVRFGDGTGIDVYKRVSQDFDGHFRCAQLGQHLLYRFNHEDAQEHANSSSLAQYA